MKRIALLCMLFLPLTAWAQKHLGLVALFMEWKKAGANAELHMYGDGKGPYELMQQTGETTTETWSIQMIQWLKARGFINK